MNSPLAPFSGAIIDLEPWIESTFSAARLYDRGVYDTVIPPARFAAANPGRAFAPLANPGPRLILADNITAEALPLQKALQAQRDAAITAFDLATDKAQTFLAALIAAVPEDAQLLMRNNNIGIQGLTLQRFYEILRESYGIFADRDILANQANLKKTL